MRMPGFTAEASVYISRTRYNMTATKFFAVRAGIRPQIRPWPPEDCIPGCICVSPINCPCCKSIWPLPWPGPKDETIF